MDSLVDREPRISCIIRVSYRSMCESQVYQPNHANKMAIVCKPMANFLVSLIHNHWANDTIDVARDEVFPAKR